MSVVIKNLKKAFDGQPILNGINLEIPQGTILGIIGKSGAGKSTLLRCLNGLEIPDEGDILIQDVSLISSLPNQRVNILRKLGNVFQQANLLSRLTALENVAFPLILLGINRNIANERAEKALALVGLKGFEERYPSQLSGGQSQRVAIARAVVGEAQLLLCDEFTSALDPQTSLEILEVLKDINQRLGLTILLITHDMTVVREVCDHVCVLEEGRIVEKNSVENILLHPSHPTTQSLIRHLFHKELPHHLLKEISPVPTVPSTVYVQLLFSSQAAQEPLISYVTKTFGIDINIIAGSLDHIRHRALGNLFISLPYEEKRMDKILTFFEERGVKADVLGYRPEKRRQK